MSERERRTFYAKIDAEVEGDVNAVADDLRSWITARRSTGQVGPGPTTTIVSTEPLRERRPRRPRWANNMNDRDEDE